ncbi:MAG TPA: phenylalanine--tRNA ligase beta subunit-related protein, partial [Candidatus Saccharimonadales bacterium]|nr:phenylalanine--tRNA ligase beta subunit-related protein [Candidatus Saccharimonadales bacterium]
IRGGRTGETLELLDRRTIELSSEDIVVAAGETAIGLAGAMGGASTEVDGNTKNILIESATFNLYNLRTTQMRHGIFSEAITRFTKGQPAQLAAPVLAEVIRLLEEWTGAKRVSDIAEDYPHSDSPKTIKVSTDFINNTLGTGLTLSQIVDTLKHVEFDVAESEDTVEIEAPYWRADIHIAEDIVEEIGRLNGYDTITPTLPKRDFTAISPSGFDKFRATLRSILARSGANEILTYSFVHGDILQRSHQKLEDSYRIVNSISPDLQYYRQSLTPSLLQQIHPNIKNGFDSFALFEMNKTHPKQRGMTDESVPDESNSAALVIVSKKASDGAPYYQAKKVIEYVGVSLGLRLKYVPLENEVAYPTAAPFEYRRSAVVVDVHSGEPVGMVGEYKKTVMKNFKLPDFIAGFELDLDALYAVVQANENDYKPSGRYPSTERDICFQVSSDILYDDVILATRRALDISDIETNISPVDIYQPADAQTKNITIRIKLTAHDRTLIGDEVAKVIDAVIKQVTEATNAQVV